MRELLEKLGLEVDDAKVDEVMLEMDADGEGSVERQEFLWWWKRAGKVYREKMTALKDELNEVKALFDEFDEDASGEIGATELRSLIAMLGVRMNEDELEDTMEELDKDGSGGEIAMLSRRSDRAFRANLESIAVQRWTLASSTSGGRTL